MRLVVIGCEYAGKTTLIDALMSEGAKVGINFHWDDHFSIPTMEFFNEAEQEAMVAWPPKMKERFQRFQIYYHIEVLKDHFDCLLGGYHIEEEIYGRRYYYPNNVFQSPYWRSVEAKVPPDTILLQLTASPDVIRRRMRESPHRFPVVPLEDVETVAEDFASQYQLSWLERKLTIETSDLTPDQLFRTFRLRVVPHLETRDLLRWKAVGWLD